MGHLFRTTTLIALLALSGCASTADTNATSLSAAFDCLRTSNAAVVSAHRAGSGPGVPENSLIGIRASIAAGVAVLEIDVALSADDVPVLMHDRTLDRTTTGRGPVSGLRLSQLQTYMLRDPSGALSSERVPTLAEALAASNGKAVLMLDIKTGVSDEDPNWQRRYRRVVQEIARSVTSARARQQVAFIAYSAQESAMVHETAPWAMQSVSVSGETPIERYSASGLPTSAMIAFTGTRAPNRDLYQQLAGQSVEVIFGTLGRAGTRLDDVYARDGNLSEYRGLMADGVQVIATDTPIQVQGALGAQTGAKVSACFAPAGFTMQAR